MIQVCSSCGTRWNVRDQRREWCPRCRGALLAPAGAAPAPATVDAAASAVTPAAAPTPAAGPAAPARPGYRWIAVRPGAPPRPRHTRTPLGPTPHYRQIPRWSLPDAPPAADDQAAVEHTGPSARAVEIAAKIALAAVFGAAAAYLLRYLLMVLNRTVLIYPFVAIGANLLAVLGAAAALMALAALAIVLTRWLILRRERVFAGRNELEPRSRPEMWAGCLVPGWNLFWAPVYLIELVTAEGSYHRFRRSIRRWWLLWAASALVSTAVLTVTGFALWTGHVTDAQGIADITLAPTAVLTVTGLALWTGHASDAQGIADTTLAATVAYLLAGATVWSLLKILRELQAKPVDRPLHRWVIADGAPPPAAGPAAESVGEPEPVVDSDARPAAVSEPSGAERVA